MKRIILFVVAMLCAVSLFSQQGKPELTIQIEPMYMGVWMGESVLNVGNVYNYEDSFTYDVDEDYNVHYAESYGATSTPLNLEMQGVPLIGADSTPFKYLTAVRPELIFRMNQWGVGASGWWFKANSSLEGTVSTPKSTFPDDYLVPGETYTYYVNGVQLWDQAVIPVSNDLEESGYSPVSYWAKNDISISTVDAFVLRTLAENQGSHIDMTLGGKYVKVENNRDEGMKMRAHATGYYDYGDWTYASVFDNNITLESKSSANHNLFGAVVGFRGKGDAGIFGVEGFLNQGLLFGTLTLNSVFTDTDDVTVDTTYTSYYKDQQYAWRNTELLSGTFPSDKQATVFVPVTEAKLKFLVNFGKHFSIGAGGFASILWGIPVAQRWSFPSDWNWVQAGWKMQETNLVFWGAFVAARLVL